MTTNNFYSEYHSELYEKLKLEQLDTFLEKICDKPCDFSIFQARLKNYLSKASSSIRLETQKTLVDAASIFTQSLCVHASQLACDFLTPSAVKKLRQVYEPELVSFLLTQLDLRKVAVQKHGHVALDLLFTRNGFEQSTRYEVAKIHAEHFAKADLRKIADLGCGIGIDSLAIAQLINKDNQHIYSYEIDENTYCIACSNLVSAPNATVVNQDISNISLSEMGFDAFFVDPARRKDDRRIADPNKWSPPLDKVYTWVQNCPNACVKVAPGIDYKDLHPQAQAMWVSYNGQLLECCLHFGKLRQGDTNNRLACVIKQENFTDSKDNLKELCSLLERADHSQQALTQSEVLEFIDRCHKLKPSTNIYLLDTHTQVNQEATSVEVAEYDGNCTPKYIIEADPAVLRAGGLHEIAKASGAKLISQGISYLICDSAVSTDGASQSKEILPFIQQWKILEQCQLKPKKINQMLAKYDIGSLEIKKRGSDITPDILRKSLKLKGKGEATLFVTRYLGKHTAILATKI